LTVRGDNRVMTSKIMNSKMGVREAGACES